jgi:glycosyltransferase involved in cell wall biosynthesis
MKILQLNTEKTWRGGEKQTYYTILGLLQKGIRVGILCRKNSPLFYKAKELQTKFSELKIYTSSGYLRDAYHLLKIARDYDILHAQTAKTHTVAAITRPLHGKKIIYTRRSHFPPKNFLTKFKYKMTDKVVAISYSVKNILNSAGIKCDEVIYSCVFPYPLNYKNIKNFETKSGIKLNPKSKKIVGTFSALVPHKDPVTLVKTIKELKKMRNDFIFLHFGGGFLEKKVKKLIKTWELEDVYYLLGFEEEVEDYFLILDVYVLTSSGEALGSSILDAFYYKVPVVASDTGGIREVVEGRGLLCPVGDYKCFARAINKILDDKELKNKLVGKAYEFVVKECLFDSHIEKYLKIYKEILNKNV